MVIIIVNARVKYSAMIFPFLMGKENSNNINPTAGPIKAVTLFLSGSAKK